MFVFYGNRWVMNRKTVSVAMAAYNGEKYIQKQIETILPQLAENDELIISLDPSTDHTYKIIESFQDPRILVIDGKGKGAIKNFENAIEHCKNEIVFLCDQDDIWTKDKVEKVLQAFDDGENIQVVLHDAKVFQEDRIIIESFFKYRNTKIGMVHNIKKNGYLGCCMAFSSQLKPYILPFPEKIPMHDMWIGLVGEKKGKNVLLPETLTYYRRHGENVTSMNHAGVAQMIKWRWDLIGALRKVKV